LFDLDLAMLEVADYLKLA